MADVEPLYCAEQIKVPDALPVRVTPAPLWELANKRPSLSCVPPAGSTPTPHFCYLSTASPFANWQEIMKEWTKEVLRAQPADIFAWSAKYFAEKAAQNAASGGSAAGGGGGK